MKTRYSVPQTEIMDLQLNSLVLAGSPGTEDFHTGTGGNPDDAI